MFSFLFLSLGSFCLSSRSSKSSRSSRNLPENALGDQSPRGGRPPTRGKGPWRPKPPWGVDPHWGGGRATQYSVTCGVLCSAFLLCFKQKTPRSYMLQKCDVLLCVLCYKKPKNYMLHRFPRPPRLLGIEFNQ